MFDGNGNWTSDFSAQADRDNGIKILASRFDNIFIADIKESFENCLTKDGQIAPIGAFNMGGQKITNLANGTNSGDAVNKSQLDTLSNSAVKLTGAQTIADTKTFTSSPIIPTPSSSDNSTKTATTAFVKDVLSSSGNGLATYTKNASANIKFSNGFIIARGQFTRASTGTNTITFSTPFSSNNYTIVLEGINNGTDWLYEESYVKTKSSTGFTTYTYHNNFSTVMWIAFGY